MCSLGQSENHERTPRVPAQLPRRRPSGSTPKASQRNHTSKLGTFSLRRNTKVHRRMPLHNHVENKYLLLLPATSPTPTHSKASMYSTHPIAGDNSSTFKVDTINHLHQIHVRVLSPAPHRRRTIRCQSVSLCASIASIINMCCAVSGGGGSLCARTNRSHSPHRGVVLFVLEDRRVFVQEVAHHTPPLFPLQQVGVRLPMGPMQQTVRGG
jgi:hypothetical protein